MCSRYLLVVSVFLTSFAPRSQEDNLEDDGALTVNGELDEEKKDEGVDTLLDVNINMPFLRMIWSAIVSLHLCLPVNRMEFKEKSDGI